MNRCMMKNFGLARIEEFADAILQMHFTPFPNKPLCYVYAVKVSKNNARKGDFARNAQFNFFQ